MGDILSRLDSKALIQDVADGYLKTDLNTHFIQNKAATLPVVSDDGIEGLYAGDTFIMNRSLKPKPGRVILAKIDGEYCLHHLVRQGSALLIVEIKVISLQMLESRNREKKEQFVTFRSAYLFDNRFYNLARGNEKGWMENMVKFVAKDKALQKRYDANEAGDTFLSIPARHGLYCLIFTGHAIGARGRNIAMPARNL